MDPTRVLAVLVSVAAGLLLGTPASSEDSSSPDSPSAAPTTAPAAAEKPPAVSPPRRGSKRERRPKEVEGAKALNRFEAETGLKSRYHLNGKQLEVDPD